jgi:hypothetical protein
MKKEFVMRGQTASGSTEKLSFSGHKLGYAYRLKEFQLFPSTAIGQQFVELAGTITAGKTQVDPETPNFNDEGLIASIFVGIGADATARGNATVPLVIINDTFLITQDLILAVTDIGSAGTPVNWQCRFESVKMSGPEEAVTNYKQFMISDG